MEGNQVARRESGPRIAQVSQTAKEQARADQQQQGERHLTDHQRFAQASTSVPGSGHRTGLVLERGRHVRISRLQRGDQTEEQPGGQRHGEVEQQNARIRRGRQPQRSAGLRQKAEQGLYAGVRQSRIARRIVFMGALSFEQLRAH